jgi:3-dehydroquinate synthase
MRAAVHLAQSIGYVAAPDAAGILDAVDRYGPIPALCDIPAERIAARLVKDKKTIQGKVHFVLPRRIGEVAVVSGVDDGAVLSAIRSALA